MNIILDIQKDKDIVQKTSPSIEEVKAFAEETGPGPELGSMHFSFDVPEKHAWKADLAEQFIGEFMKHWKIKSDEELLVYELFTTRLNSLKQ